MPQPLEDVIRNATGFLIIGNSADDRFPAFSYNAYARLDKRFFCLDLGGLTESRGPTKGGKVYTAIEDLPDDRGDLAILWVKPSKSVEAVDLAHEARYTRVWFSFKTATPESVARAREHGMEIVEVGRCPVYYLDSHPMACKVHTLVVKSSGLYGRPPSTEADPERREIM
jgi:hypothetical protein